MGAATLALSGLTIWLRLRALGYTEFGGDQSLSLTMALEWVHGGPLPLASLKSSLGVYNFPLVEYLWAMPLFFKADVSGVLWFIALLNLAGLGAAAWATARVFGWRTAWWATLLFAVNPWAVYYGHLIWMQTLVPGFASIFYACLLLYFADQPKAIYLIGGALSLSAVIQSHPTAVVLSVLVILLGICFHRRLRLKPLLISAGLFLLSFAPYLVFEIRHRFVDWYALRAGLGQPAEISLAPLNLVLELLQSQRIYDTLGSAAARWQSLDLAWPVDTVIAGLLGLAIGVSVVAVVVQVWRRHTPWLPRQIGRLILLLWFCLPVLFFLRHNYPLQNYYFLYLYPIPFVLLALLADEIYARLISLPAGWPAARWAAPVVFLPLALIAFQQARLDVIGQSLLAAGASGRQRVVDTQRAIESARQLLGSHPECKLVVMGRGGFSLLQEFTQNTYGAYPNRVRFVEEGGYLLPDACTYYFAVTADAGVRDWLAAFTRPLPAYTIRTPEQTWTFYDLPAADSAALKRRLFNDAQPLGEWENGVQLKTYTLQGDLRPGSTVSVNTWWAVTRAVPLREIHFGTYLLTAGNQVVAQADGAGINSLQWQPGDLFQTVFDLALPAGLQPGSYSLAQALYFYPEVSRIPLAQRAGDLLWLNKLTVSSPTP
jgi:4-amino-4-deoxy-L-arabinose transferase-like glycosyltransferase